MSVRVLIAKVGLDGHDRGAILVTKRLKDHGMDAFFSGIRRTPEEIASMAVRLQADCIGLSSHAGAHVTQFPRIVQALRRIGWNGRLIIAGGLIPSEDVPALLQAGIHAVFPADTPISVVVNYIRSSVSSMETPAKIR